MDKIERVQNRAMRTILEKPSGTKSEPLRGELGWAKLSSRRQLQTGIKTYKIINRIPPKYFSGH